MFKEPGKKLKVMCYIVIVAVMLFCGYEATYIIPYHGRVSFIEIAYRFVIGAAVGFLGGYVSTLALYTFAEMSEDVSAIKQNILESKEKSNKE